jgi:hypothetical protein
MPDIKELNKDSGLTVGAIIAIVWMVAITVFTGTTIYWNFGLVQKDLDAIEVELQTEIKLRKEANLSIHGRIDKKTARNATRLDALEKPEPDK